jgi:hypothetical protein
MISIGSDMLYELNALTDNASGAPINTATVTGVLLMADGVTPVAGSSFALAYVAASAGNYEGVLPASVTALLTAGWGYVVQRTAVYSGFTRVWKTPDTAGYPS